MTEAEWERAINSFSIMRCDCRPQHPERVQFHSPGSRSAPWVTGHDQIRTLKGCHNP